MKLPHHASVGLLWLVVIAAMANGCHRQKEGNELMATRQAWPVVVQTLDSSTVPLHFLMSMKKKVYEVGDLVEIRLRVENRGGSFVAFDSGKAWWHDCLNVCDTSYFDAWDKRDPRIEKLAGFQPDGSDASLGVFSNEVGLARQLGPGEAVEKVVTWRAKCIGTYRARAKLSSYYEGLTKYYTNRTPDETVAVVVAGLTKFSLPPVELEFDIRELAKTHQQSVE